MPGIAIPDFGKDFPGLHALLEPPAALKLCGGIGASGMRLEGRTAIVTGGSRGIGAAIARRFAAEGADVALTYVGNAEAAGRVVSAIEVAGRKAVAIKADASDPAAAGCTVEQALGKLGPLDIIVHSAGVSEFIMLAETSVADYTDAFRRHFAVNVGGVVAMTEPERRAGGRQGDDGDDRAETLRPGRGDRGLGRVPGQRRVLVYHRDHDRHRWWLLGVNGIAPAREPSARGHDI